VRLKVFYLCKTISGEIYIFFEIPGKRDFFVSRRVLGNFALLRLQDEKVLSNVGL
jgi:hypothetical protein